MDKDEVRNKLEYLFEEVFHNDPINRHLQKLEGLMIYGWDDDIALEYVEELKKKLL